jgi:hypothetical protein
VAFTVWYPLRRLRQAELMVVAEPVVDLEEVELIVEETVPGTV